MTSSNMRAPINAQQQPRSSHSTWGAEYNGTSWAEQVRQHFDRFLGSQMALGCSRESK